MARTIPALRRLYRSLEADDLSRLLGRHEGRFVGPAWLRRGAPRAIALAGMPGWRAKSFIVRGDVALGRNLLEGDRKGEPMEGRLEASPFDGRPALVVRYPEKAARQWRLVVDEFRPLDDRTLLGLSMIDLPGLRRLALPFLLER